MTCLFPVMIDICTFFIRNNIIIVTISRIKVLYWDLDGQASLFRLYLIMGMIASPVVYCLVLLGLLWGNDKMVGILQTTFFKLISLSENVSIWHRISDLILGVQLTKVIIIISGNGLSLFDTKPLPKPMMTQLMNAYMHHLASMC